MKKLLAILTLAFIAATPLSLLGQSDLKKDPGYLDIDDAFNFKTIKPEVNINLPKFLLKDALAEFDGGKDDPLAGSGLKVSELINDIKLIRVVVIERKNTNNHDAVAKGMATLRSTLEKKWTPIVVVSEKNENVGIYAMSDPSGESTAGLAILVHEQRGDAVIANIVGRVSLGKLVKAASKMDKFPKDLIQKLTNATNTAETGATEKPKSSSDKPATSAP